MLKDAEHIMVTNSTSSNLKEGKDFYYDEKGLMVLTADYLFRRGYCCESGCRHCPYGYGQKESVKNGKKKPSYEI